VGQFSTSGSGAAVLSFGAGSYTYAFPQASDTLIGASNPKFNSGAFMCFSASSCSISNYSLWGDGSNTIVNAQSANLNLAIGGTTIVQIGSSLTTVATPLTVNNVFTAQDFKATTQTISSLPTCNAGNVGDQRFVSNGVTAPTYHLAVSSTGTGQWPVWCTYNGSTYSWVY